MTKNKDAITWLQFNNIFPIVVAIVTAALSFAALRTDIAVIKNDQQNELSLLTDIKNQQHLILSDINNLHLADAAMQVDIGRLMAIHAIK
jgi:hypothetical protein